MKSWSVLLFGIVSAFAATHDRDSTVERKVTVCFETFRDPWLVHRAAGLASSIYAPIGVAIDWHFARPSCPENAILIYFRDETPDNIYPGALAYSTPYEGIHIEVFYDRILRTVEPKLVPVLLAHVLVHESAHILQGVARHSPTGIMKAKWGHDDYERMATGSLQFTPQDIAFIGMGLEKRAARQPLTSNPR